MSIRFFGSREKQVKNKIKTKNLTFLIYILVLLALTG